MAVARNKLEEVLPPPVQLTSHLLTHIHSRFDRALRGYLMRNLDNQADAEDFVQEVYLRLARQEGSRHIDCIRAFVFTTAKNLLRDRSRRLSTRLQQASVCCDEMPLGETSLDPAGRTLDDERLQLFFDAFEQTNDNAQRAFILSRIEGLSYAAIAERMEVSVSMIEKHISTVLRSLEAVDD